EALIGARETIEKNVPKLAICVYHRPDDLIKLSKLIYEFECGKKYSYFLRNHSNHLAETVLYAIPK
nr:FkbM family methyltransferase [Lachnospiraceae bacterium]